MQVEELAVEAPIVKRLGLVPYREAYERMQRFTSVRTATTPDELWLLEHPPVYTVGLAGRREHFPKRNACSDIPLEHVDRGGQITYHGPGQIILYALLNLARRGLHVRELVQLLEQSVIDVLAGYGVQSSRRSGAPGVYVDGAKVAALGLRVRRGCTYHGLALNVAMQLAPFGAIDPCGMPSLAVTQTRDLGIIAPAGALADQLARRFIGLLST